jgi:hypothetical protein
MILIGYFYDLFGVSDISIFLPFINSWVIAC